MKKTLQYLFLILIFVCVPACKESAIVHDLTERDANAIMVLLAKNNINSVKESELKNQEVSWIVKVDKKDEVLAQSILVANKLPKVRQGGLRGICEDTSMIVTEETEQCRKLLAYKGEIINSLESIPGVVSADVVLNIPDKVEFPDENTQIDRPTASVTIMYLTDANVRTDLNEGKVQEFVANSITGMDARDVSVIISYLEQKIEVDPTKPSDKTKNADKDDANKGDANKGDASKDDKNKTIDTLPHDTTDQTETTTLIEGTEPDQVKTISVGGIMMDQKSAKKFKIISAVFLGLLLLVSAAFVYALLRMSKLRKLSSVDVEPQSPAVVDDKKEKKMLGA
ncbi:MAG: hypothetical protein HQM16_13450 [Deltaproteobacteria bacterium]|nr:hypothetical protein [Deltaproteobacteria bacterium]